MTSDARLLAVGGAGLAGDRVAHDAAHAGCGAAGAPGLGRAVTDRAAGRVDGRARDLGVDRLAAARAATSSLVPSWATISWTGLGSQYLPSAASVAYALARSSGVGGGDAEGEGAPLVGAVLVVGDHRVALRRGT